MFTNLLRRLKLIAVPSVQGTVNAFQKAIDKVSAALTSDKLAELNKKVDIDKADPATVASDFLKDEKLI